MPGKVQVSGTFRTASAIKVKVAGTWRNATQAYVKIAGDWRQWFSTGVVDTFSRTTSSNLGTSESSIPWASRFGTWTANGSVAVSSNAVSSGTAGALSYVDLANKNALTSVSTPNAGVGPAFWVTSAGSWWAAHLISDQTNTTYTYACNCTCNGHNETTCNSCYNSGFGTNTQRAYYGATTYQSTTVDTSSWVQTSGSPVVSTYNYTHAYFNTETCACPAGQTQFFDESILGYRCYSYETVIDTIRTCFQTYGSGTVNSFQSCTGCYAYGTFLGCCEVGSSGAYQGCRAYTTKQVYVPQGIATCSWDSCAPEYQCPSAVDACCTRSPATYSSTCSDGSTYRIGGCYNYVTSSAQTCPNGGVLWQETGSSSCASCPNIGYGPGTLSYSFTSPTCYADYQAPNYGTSCSLCGTTTTFISGGTYPNCDSYGSTCQTCSGGSITNNYYLQIIYSTAGSAAYTVYSTSSMLASQPTSIQVSTGNNTATVTPYSGGTSLGNFTATNTGTKGNGAGIVKAFAGTVNQATTVDNFSSTPLDIAPLTVPVTYLVVAAGGGGGQRGGGGGGGLLTGSTTIARDSATTVIVGAGGGTNGNNSVLGLLTAIGGGQGGVGSAGSAGGSGGGGGSWVDVPSYTGQAYPGGAGTSGQGFAGGAGGIGLPSSYSSGGGGGGAAGAGEPGQSGHPAFIGGHGGLAYLSSITGTATYYAGGGGGFGQSQGGVGGIGGPQVHANGIPYSLYATKKGGAGNGANYQDIDNNQYYNPQGGQANTGGGAGGGLGSAPSWNSGSGVVIISYPTSYGLAVATTGSPTQTTAGSNYVYKFTGTGSITF